jgi:hypothetical protein
MLFLSLLIGLGLLFDSAVQAIAKSQRAEEVLTTNEYVGLILNHMMRHLIDLPNCVMGSVRIAYLTIKINKLIFRKTKGDVYGKQQ